MNRALNVSFQSARNRFVCAAHNNRIPKSQLNNSIAIFYNALDFLWPFFFLLFIEMMKNWHEVFRVAKWRDSGEKSCVCEWIERASSWCCDRYNTGMADRASAKWCHVVTKCCNVCFDIRASNNSHTHYLRAQIELEILTYVLLNYVFLFWIFILISKSSTAK